MTEKSDDKPKTPWRAPPAPFNRAIKTVLLHEGGFVDSPADPGGATNWGISLRFLRALGDLDGDGYRDGDLDRDGDVDAEDIRAMTRDQAIELYRSQWWDRYGYERITTPEVHTKIFDLAVNMGAGMAHVVAQRALRAVGRPVAEDGILGPATVDALNSHMPYKVLPALRSEAAGHYRTLPLRNPKLAQFLPGWLNRAYA